MIIHANQIQYGVYKFELYGASGGSARNVVSTYRFENNTCISDAVVRRYNGNTACLQMSSIGGAGGYISGKIRIPRETVTFLTVGGKGIYSHTLIEMSTARCFSRKYMIPGGYGGGGSASNFCDVEGSEACGTGSGGGQTAVKFSENDLWHGVMVSGGGGGGGGGTDNIFGTFGGNEDGSGGAGGNLVAQSWFAGGVLQKQYFADSTKGFTFGTGEGARYGTPKNNKAVPNGNNVDNGGAGGGWFGGFASQQGDAGAGGGSSWALTSDAVIPSGNIEARDDLFENAKSHPYAFNKSSEYLFTEVVNVGGIWNGNGRIIITLLDFILPRSCVSYVHYFFDIMIASLVLN